MKCECCGGNDLKKQGSNSMICSFCGSVYLLDANENIMSKEVTDAKIISLFLEAEKYRKAEKYGDEIQVLVKAIEMDENKPLSWVKLGRAYRMTNFFDKAIECYNKAISIDPAYPQSYANIGAVYLVKKDYAKAIEFYEKGISLFSTDDNEFPTVLANYGLAVAMSGDKKKAAKLINDAERKGYPNATAARKAAGLSRFSKRLNIC
jgi:tetratricopeptide (TPR) repeat protein